MINSNVSPESQFGKQNVRDIVNKEDSEKKQGVNNKYNYIVKSYGDYEKQLNQVIDYENNGRDDFEDK